MQIPRETLAGERLTLRPTQARDAGPYLQAFADDPRLAAMIGFDPPDERTTRGAFRRDARDRDAGTAARFAVLDAREEFLGLFLLHSFAWSHRRADCGFMVVPGVRGRGVALEALRLLVGWAFTTLGLQRVGLATLEANAAAQRLAERAGFEREGVLRAYTLEWGDPVDNLVYSATSATWA